MLHLAETRISLGEKSVISLEADFPWQQDRKYRVVAHVLPTELLNTQYNLNSLEPVAMSTLLFFNLTT